jgi:hypothetical protein
MNDARFGMLLMLSMAMGSGCGGSSSPDNQADMKTDDQSQPDNGVHNFSQINDQVFKTNCSLSGCHAAASSSAANGLDLETDPYHALVNQPSVNGQAHSEGKLRVDPCHPENSFLITKLNLMTDNTPFGTHMPAIGGVHLPEAQIQGISDWIARGAVQDEPATVTGTTCTLPGQ